MSFCSWLHFQKLLKLTRMFYSWESWFLCKIEGITCSHLGPISPCNKRDGMGWEGGNRGGLNKFSFSRRDVCESPVGCLNDGDEF